MQLTLHADYGLRALIYLAHHSQRPVSTQEIADVYRISRHHLVRVMQTLARHGFVEMHPGRTGGATLAQSPASINLGAVVQACEPGFDLVECFDHATNRCPIVPVCKLKGLLAAALQAFFGVLSQYTLADALSPEQEQVFQELLQITPKSLGHSAGSPA